MKNKKNSGLVYSTEYGRMCPGCNKVVSQCECESGNRPVGDGIVRVGRETKGRKGKGVSIVSGLLLDSEAMKKLAKQLKQKCGTGGAVKNGVIEIQGDQRDILMVELKKLGYTVKRSGG